MDNLRIAMDVSLRINDGAPTNHPHDDKKKESRSIKRSNFNDIVDDLLIEILIRMPFDSVCRCKSVSRSWFSLISCDSFTQKYMLRKPICWNALVQTRGCNFDDITLLNYVNSVTNRQCDFGTKTSAPCKISQLSFSFLPKEAIEKIYLQRSCNGLLLCESHSTKLFYVCNPLTKQWVALPPPPTSKNKRNIGFTCRYYRDPRFKVVLVHYGTLSCFCSERGVWGELRLSWPDTGEIVASNGMLYGLSYTKLHAYDPYNKPNEVGTIDLPSELRRCIRERIEENQGKIRFYQFTKTDRSCHMFLQVWELDDYESSKWCFINKISFSAKISRLLEEGLSGTIVYIDEDIAYIWTWKHVLIRCNMKTRMVNLVISDNVPRGYLRPFLFPCPTPVPQGW